MRAIWIFGAIVTVVVVGWAISLGSGPTSVATSDGNVAAQTAVTQNSDPAAAWIVAFYARTQEEDAANTAIHEGASIETFMPPHRLVQIAACAVGKVDHRPGAPNNWRTLIPVLEASQAGVAGQYTQSQIENAQGLYWVLRGAATQCRDELVPTGEVQSAFQEFDALRTANFQRARQQVAEQEEAQYQQRVAHEACSNAQWRLRYYTQNAGGDPRGENRRQAAANVERLCSDTQSSSTTSSGDEERSACLRAAESDANIHWIEQRHQCVRFVAN